MESAAALKAGTPVKFILIRNRAKTRQWSEDPNKAKTLTEYLSG